MEDFCIQIDDGSELLPSLVVQQNTKSVNLFDWQVRAIEYFFKHDCNAIYEAGTGVGKTFCAIMIIKKIWKIDPNVRVLIVVPKNVILETGWYKELYEAGVSLKDIGVYYGAIKEYAKVTITNMQSLSKIALGLFQCVIFDECFEGNTLLQIKINNEKKEMKIKDIVDKKIQCEVLSFNIEKNKKEYKKIQKFYKIREKRKVMKIILEDNTELIITPEQLLYNGKEYIQANKLKEGDVLRCLK
jgi:hypothetical protein